MHVAIVAMGPSADAYARHCAMAGGRPSHVDEMWTVNAFGSIFQADRIFHMDDVRIQQIRADGGNEQIANMLKWMKKHPGPIYTSRGLPDKPQTERIEQLRDAIALDDAENDKRKWQLRTLEVEAKLVEDGGFPGLVEYPLQDVVNTTGNMPYFNSTPAYAVALAIHEKVTRLSLYGMDYSFNDKYQAERGKSCIEYWLGRATERNIDICLPRETWLLDTNRSDKLYGYDTRIVTAYNEPDGTVRLEFTERERLPTAEQIEAAYNHEVKEKTNGKCSVPSLQNGADQRLDQRVVEHQHDDQRSLCFPD